MNIEKRRAEIAARKAEIRKLIEGDSENKLNMDDLEKELRELNEEDEKLEKRQAIERMLNGGAAPASPAGLSNPVARSANQPAPESAEKLYRSAWLKTLQGKPLTDDEKRAYSTAPNSGLPIIPETTANQIIKKMYEVAPILQRCKIFHVPGNFKFAIEGTNDEAALHTENAAITAAPKLFTSPCTIKMPRFITDCCTQVKMEYPAISLIRLAWMGERLHSARSCGHLMSAQIMMPIPETYCAMTVAPAAPATPKLRPMTNHKSSAIFKTAETAKNTSGTTELPTARR